MTLNNEQAVAAFEMARGWIGSLLAPLGIKVAFWNVTRKYDTDKPEHLCPWPFERAYVASDLRVVPCCIIGNPDVSEVGTADGDFSAVWTGNALRDFRQAHVDGKVPAVCRSCYVQPGESR